MDNLQSLCNSLIVNDNLISQNISSYQIQEGRDIYLDSLKYNNFDIIMKNKLIDPLIHKLNIKSVNNNSIKVKIIPKYNIDNSYNKFIINNIFTLGRSYKCDITINDIDISRIQFFGIIINNKIIILDTWSLFGTKIYDNKNINNNCINNRNILKFNKDERFILELSNHIIVLNPDKIINKNYCIICMTSPRIIKNSCRCTVLCLDCYNYIYLF